MNIKLSSIIDPERNAAFAVPAIALSMVVFAYSVRFGPLSVLAFYLCWLVPVALAPRIVLARPGPVALLLVVPVFFALSTLWSDAPFVTLRASVQYGITVFAGLVAARIVSVPNLVTGGVIGGLVVLLYSAVNGGYSYDYIDGSYAFNGAFSSKNQLGYFATLAILFSFSLGWIFRSRGAWVALAAGTGFLGLVMLWMSDSTTSLLSGIAAFSAIVFVGFVMLLAPWLRRATVFLAATACGAVVLLAYQLSTFDRLLGAFGKDSTLTGRTYLWNRAFEIGAQQPTLGLGYNAFWVHGRPDAEILWDQFYITARSGFHFHNLLIETYVGTGMLGLALVLALSLLLIVMPIGAALGRGSVGSLMLFSGLGVLFVVRSVAEVDFVTPHTVGSFLVAYVLLRLFDHNRSVRHAMRLSLPDRMLPSSSPTRTAESFR